MSTKDLLKELLSKVIQLNDTVIEKIIDKCSSVEDLYYLTTEDWQTIDISKEDLVKILNHETALLTANTRAKNQKKLSEVFKDPKDMDPDDFYKKNKKSIDTEMDNIDDEKKRKIYAIYFKHYQSNSNWDVVPLDSAARGLLIYMTQTYHIVLSNLSYWKTQHPDIFSNLITTVDDLNGLITETNFFASLEINVLSGTFLFAVMSVLSIQKNFGLLLDGKINILQFFKNIGVDIAAYAASSISATAGGIGGAYLGSLFFPVIGTAIGGFIGSLFGHLTSKILFEPNIRLMFGQCEQELEQITTEELYKEALEALNANEFTPKKLIIKVRKTNLLINHPDKITDESQKAKCHAKLIQLEKHYKIIETYRKKKGTWDD